MGRVEYPSYMNTAVVVKGLVPFAHVADPARSIDFYRRLGFTPSNVWEYGGDLAGAFLVCGNARLLISLATAPINPEEQAILLYLYTDHVGVLREQLLADGIQVSEVQHPSHMPAGEILLHDPDGYCLLVGRPAHDPADRAFGQSASTDERPGHSPPDR